MSMRKKLVEKILDGYSGELTKEDLITMISETEEELVDRLIEILDYYKREYNSLDN